MGDREIEGSFTRLPPPGFSTREKAAFAIAAQLHPDDKKRRAEAAERLEAVIYTALCTGQLVGRDPDLRLPIEWQDLTGALMLAGCIISDADLNSWLADVGIGVVMAPQTSTYCPALPLDGQSGNPALSKLPSDSDLLVEQTELKGVTNKCNVRLGKKYGVKSRDIKDACTRARKAAKDSKNAVSGSYVSTVHKMSSC